MHRSVVVLTLTLATVAYAAVRLSPMREEIGRTSPALASFFSAPSFNFFAAYETGAVLEFEIGMSRDELMRALEQHYSSLVLLNSSCGGQSLRPMIVTVEDKELWEELVSRSVICASIRSRDLSLVFYLDAGKLKRIEVAKVTFEAI